MNYAGRRLDARATRWRHLGLPLIGLAAIAMFGLLSATASVVYAATIYSNSFAYPANNNVATATSGDWTDSDGDGTDVIINDNERLVMRNGTTSQTNLAGNGTAGFSNIVVSLTCRGVDDNDDAENEALALLINDGTNGNVEIVRWGAGPSGACGSTSGFEQQTVDLTDTATYPALIGLSIDDNPDLVVRLRAVGLNTDNEQVRVDDVVVTGDPILTANLVIVKECLGAFEQSFIIGVTPEGEEEGVGTFLGCGGQSSPIELLPGSYIVEEDEEFLEVSVDDIRYRGACDGGGQLVITEEDIGQTLTCVVTNVNLVTLTVNKVCDPADMEGSFEIELYRETDDPGNLETTFNLACDGSDTFEIDDGVVYVISETAPGGDIAVTYGEGEGDDCTQDGEAATVQAEGEDVSCAVTNTEASAEPATITVVKDFTDDGESTVDITVDCGAAIVELVSGDGTLSDEEQAAYEVSSEGDSVECTVSETDLPGYDESVICEQTEVIGEEPYGGSYTFQVEIGLTYTCTFTNTPDEAEELGFAKYTDAEDEVLSQFEEFTWYVNVPAAAGSWYLWDFLPPGTVLTGVNAPEGVACAPILALGLLCRGDSSEEAVVIELTVRASIVCGEYTNIAKLFVGVSQPQLAHDTVTVCGEEIPDEEIDLDATRPVAPSGGSWWDRLWGAIRR